MTTQVIFNDADLFNKSAEDIFSRLVRSGNGGTSVKSSAAPALSTQFVKSKYGQRVQVESPGAFAEISYPAIRDVAQRSLKKHGNEQVFGYMHTMSTDLYPGGFGERSARALAREENTYQLKGAFPAAMLSFTKLRARVEARQGDVQEIERMFARMWGLELEEVEAIPHLHLDGSEATRMSAMEDRAYHALSGHPGHNGGYRVDTATLAPDALGGDVPLNWPRLRTGLKAIAVSQSQGDEQINMLIDKVRQKGPAQFYMDIVAQSQPRYIRAMQWEVLMSKLMSTSDDVSYQLIDMRKETDLQFALVSTIGDAALHTMLESDDYRMSSGIRRIASIVATTSSRALTKTIEALMETTADKEHIDIENEDTYDSITSSNMGAGFEVPRYKLTKTSISRGIRTVTSGRDITPDMRSGGAIGKQLDLREFRESGLVMPLDVPGALHMAAYFASVHPHARPATQALVNLVKVPPDPSRGKIAVRLRDERLYADQSIRDLGSVIFSTQFRAAFEMLASTMIANMAMSERSIKSAIWDYLSKRCRLRRQCPFEGGWRDLLIDLPQEPEGWSLLYWARITTGRRHQSMSQGVMATISAGEVVDFVSLVRRNINERLKHWTEFYTSKYTAVEERLARRKERPGSEERVDKYIPPHMRTQVLLEADSNTQRVDFEYLVEMQSKARFFRSIKVALVGNRISVGISDGGMRDMTIDFYKARWLSLDKRIKKAKEKGEMFRLGTHVFEVHPWGELLNTFPDDYEGTLRVLGALDSRAWTLPPGYLRDKFDKSISELWADIRSEIADLLDYIRTVHDGIAEEQEEALAAREKCSTLVATANVEPIPVSAFGYIAPSKMPVKTITIQTASQPVDVPMATATYNQPPADNDDELDELDDLGNDDSRSEHDDIEMSNPLAGDIEQHEQKYLTYRYIWHVMGMPEMADELIRLGFGLPEGANLDGEHLDTTYGPVALAGEEAKVLRGWERKRGLMMQRVGLRGAAILDDDM